MSIEHPNSDSDLMDLLRIAGPLSVAELADAMEVTPTAIRQRLIRLTYKTMIQREAVRAGRGRPKHRYWLTEKGGCPPARTSPTWPWPYGTRSARCRMSSGDGEMLRRIARTLAQGYAEKIQGTTAAERIRSLGELLAQRRIPVSVENSGRESSLTEHACPYPNLAEKDRSVCTMEKMLFSELLGRRGRADTLPAGQGGDDCRFQTS